MRKEIVLPGIAVAGGVLGFLVRLWNRATAFEPETGLPVAAQSTVVLLALSAAVAAGLIALAWNTGRVFPGGYDQAFAMRGNRACLTAHVICAFLLAGAGMLVLYQLPGEYIAAITSPVSNFGSNPMMLAIPRVLLGALCLISGMCVLLTGRNTFQDRRKGQYSFQLLMPSYSFCGWLICAYQQCASDPVLLNHIFEILAIILSLLGLATMAGFSFEPKKSVPHAVVFALLGVYCSFVTLADGQSLTDCLLLCFAILYLTTSACVLLYNVRCSKDADWPELKPETEAASNEPET